MATQEQVDAAEIKACEALVQYNAALRNFRKAQAAQEVALYFYMDRIDEFCKLRAESLLAKTTEPKG